MSSYNKSSGGMGSSLKAPLGCVAGDCVDSRVTFVLKFVLGFKLVVILTRFFFGNGLDSEFAAFR